MHGFGIEASFHLPALCAKEVWVFPKMTVPHPELWTLGKFRLFKSIVLSTVELV